MGHTPNPSIGDDVFMRTSDDEKISLSVEDKLFLQIMNEGFRKNQNGNWSAPLPFKSKRPSLPDNYEQALQRAKKFCALGKWTC